MLAVGVFWGWYNIDLVATLGWVILINWWLDFVCLVRVPGGGFGVFGGVLLGVCVVSLISFGCGLWQWFDGGL